MRADWDMQLLLPPSVGLDEGSSQELRPAVESLPELAGGAAAPGPASSPDCAPPSCCRPSSPSSTIPSKANHMALKRIFKRHFAVMSESVGDLNVLHRPLEKASVRPQDPVTGYTRDGYCRSHPGDGGKHTLAAVLTPAFLDFSKSRGNDLSTPRPAYGFPGLKDGCRWCLCVERWKEAFMARGEFGDDIVPKVVLGATHIDALKTVPLADMQRFAQHEPPTGRPAPQR